MIIIHGDNIIQSRKKLVEIIEENKNKGILIERFNAKDLDLPLLESKLQKTDLFGHSRMLIIEELHSLPKSKKQTSMIELLVNSSVEICLWEKRELTATMLKKMPTAKLHLFKMANSLFIWLDSLSSAENSKSNQIKLLRKALTDNEDYLCFIMLIRQIRMMIKILDGTSIPGPAFLTNKVRAQANNFSVKQLLKIHQQLYKLDSKIKTSKNILPLSQEIEQIILGF